MGTTYELIKGETLASSAASYTFTAIPSTWTDLVIRWSARSTASFTKSGYSIIVNGDTTTKYSYRYVENYDGTAGSNGNGTRPEFEDLVANGNTSTSNTFSSNELYLPNYNSTAAKPMSNFQVVENNAASDNAIRASAYLYRGTSGITSIQFTNMTFAAGSSFYLYGIKSS